MWHRCVPHRLKFRVVEVMGRHAGWIAARGAVGGRDCRIPIIILFPEVPFQQQKFVAKVKKNVEEFGYCSVVVSEVSKVKMAGFWPRRVGPARSDTHHLGGGAPVIANMVKDALGYKFHCAVADYLQRAARHIASKTDVEQAYAMGKAAVEFAVEGKTAVMPTIVRTSNSLIDGRLGVPNWQCGQCRKKNA